MKRQLTSLLAAAVLGATALAPGASAKTCRSGYTHAVIGGAQKCLHAGEYGAHAEAGQYTRYHFKCIRVNGVYRLEHS